MTKKQEKIVAETRDSVAKTVTDLEQKRALLAKTVAEYEKRKNRESETIAELKELIEERRDIDAATEVMNSLYEKLEEEYGDLKLDKERNSRIKQNIRKYETAFADFRTKLRNYTKKNYLLADGKLPSDAELEEIFEDREAATSADTQTEDELYKSRDSLQREKDAISDDLTSAYLKEERKLPLRKRIERIFRKHGFTMTAIALSIAAIIESIVSAARRAAGALGSEGDGSVLSILKTVAKNGLKIVGWLLSQLAKLFTFAAKHMTLLLLAIFSAVIAYMVKSATDKKDK